MQDIINCISDQFNERFEALKLAHKNAHQYIYIYIYIYNLERFELFYFNLTVSFIWILPQSSEVDKQLKKK